MNHLVPTFHRLLATWHVDAGDEAVDALAAEVAARVAAAGGLVCLGLIRSEAVRRLFGLACFLDGYGLTLRQRYIQGRAFALIFAEIQTARPQSEYAGATVRELELAPLRVAA